MNRRNFFKVITGFVAGVFAAKKSKADVTIFPTEEQARKVSQDIYGDPDKLYCRGKNGTLCPKCKFNYPSVSEANVAAPKRLDDLADPTKEYFKVMAKELPSLIQKSKDDIIMKAFI